MTYTEINDFLKPYAREIINFLSGNPIKSLIFFLILLKISTSLDNISSTIETNKKNNRNDDESFYD